MLDPRPTVAITLNSAWNIFNFRMGLVKGLIRAGYRVVAIAPPDLDIREIQVKGCVFVPLPELQRKGTNPASDVKLVRALYRIYKEKKVKLALHYTIKPVIYGSVAARLAGVKTINTITGLGYAFMSRSLFHYLVRGLYASALPFADRVWFHNRDDLDFFVEKKLVRKSRAGVVRGSGIDLDRFRPQGSSSPKEGFRFLFIGRLLTDKGLSELLEAARLIQSKNSGITIDIVGGLDPDNPASITPEVVTEGRHPANVVCHGRQHDVRRFIAAADAVVLPSYREGLPRVMLEGLGMAKPLITTDVPGCRDTVIHGTNGYLVPVKNAEALAEAMLTMAKLPARQREEMGKKGRAHARRNFDERVIVNQYVTAIQEMIGAPSPAVSRVVNLIAE